MQTWNDRKYPTTLVLFDVDGTLTLPRQSIANEMVEKLKALRQKVVIGFVGGSDLEKQQEQLQDQALELFDYAFPENGVVGYRRGKIISESSFIGFVGEERYKHWINFVLEYLAKLDIPKKRGTFVEFRKGLINISPIGRNCSMGERGEYEQYDKEHKIREQFVKALEAQFPDYGLKYSIGGQISIDVFPVGWDKTYCLKHVESDGFQTIHFFGDKVLEGQNDYEMMNHPKITGHAVKSPGDTIRILDDLFQ